MASTKQRILIVGAGVAGQELLSQLNRKFKSIYSIVGFVDDDPKKANTEIKSIKVLGSLSDLSRLVRDKKIAEVFIAIPSAEGRTIRKVVEECQKVKVIFRIVPRLLEIVQGKVKLHQVREVQVEDLLGRPLVQSEQKVFQKIFKGKKVIVTGAAGSIGSELSRQIIQFNPQKLILIDWWENGLYELERELENLSSHEKFVTILADIKNTEKLTKLFRQTKPDIVFHAAAFKHVPSMQRFPEEAVMNNILGTYTIAEAAVKTGVGKFIYISSDKAVDPTSIMGASKLIGEFIIGDLNKKKKTKFISVRFGNVLASHGSIVPLFKKQIFSGGPVTITDPNMTRFFMTIPEAVQLVLHASIMGQGGEIFVLEMGEQIKIVDLATLMIRLAGFVPNEDIKIKYIGIRPGEKMYEELISGTESIEKTTNTKIYKIKTSPKKQPSLPRLLNELKKAAKEGNRERVFSLLKTIAPNLQPLENIII